MKIDPNRKIDEYNIGQFGYQVGFKRSNPDDINSVQVPYLREVTITGLTYPDTVELIDSELKSTVYLIREDAVLAASERFKDQLDFLQKSFQDHAAIDPLKNLQVRTQTDTLDEIEYLNNQANNNPRMEIKPTDNIPEPKFKLGQEVYCISYDRTGPIRYQNEKKDPVYQIILTQVKGISIVGYQCETKGIHYDLYCGDRIDRNHIFERLEQAQLVREELVQKQIDYYTELLQNNTVIDERKHNADEREKQNDEKWTHAIGRIIGGNQTDDLAMEWDSTDDQDDDHPSYILSQDEINGLLGFDKLDDKEE